MFFSKSRIYFCLSVFYSMTFSFSQHSLFNRFLRLPEVHAFPFLRICFRSFSGVFFCSSYTAYIFSSVFLRKSISISSFSLQNLDIIFETFVVKFIILTLVFMQKSTEGSIAKYKFSTNSCALSVVLSGIKSLRFLQEEVNLTK